MGLIYQNPFGGEWEGRFGEMVFAKYKPGIKIGRRLPERTKPPREGELANQAAFRQSVIWAKAVWNHDLELKAKYNAAAQLKHGRGFELAKADYLRRPVVEDVDVTAYTGKPGETVLIRAVDVFELKSVAVKVQDLAGTLLEGGAAVWDSGRWVYTSKTEIAAGQTVTLEIGATDYPGHTTTRKVDHVCGPRM